MQKRERAVTMLTPPHRQDRDTPTADVLMIVDTTQGCSYCNQNQSSNSCKVVTDVGLRNRFYVSVVDVLCVSESIT